MYQEDGPHIPPPPNPIKDPSGFFSWLAALIIAFFILILVQSCIHHMR